MRKRHGRNQMIQWPTCGSGRVRLFAAPVAAVVVALVVAGSAGGGGGAYSLVVVVDSGGVPKAVAVDVETGRRRSVVLPPRARPSPRGLFSPSGELLLYRARRVLVSQDTSQEEWLEVAGPGGVARRVTPDGVSEGSWSPDGRRIVYVFNPLRDDPLPRPRGLYIAAADGSGARLVFRSPEYALFGHPRWSRDGKSVAFDWRSRGVFVVGQDGRRLRHLKRDRVFACRGEGGATQFSAPEWLGTRVLYVGLSTCSLGRTAAVFTQARGGGDERQLLGPPFRPPTTDETDGVVTAVPSPDGRAVAYEQANDNVEVKLLTSPPRVVRVGRGYIMSWQTRP